MSEDDAVPVSTSVSTEGRRARSTRRVGAGQRGAEPAASGGGRTKMPVVGSRVGGCGDASAAGGEGRRRATSRPPPPPQQQRLRQRRLQPAARPAGPAQQLPQQQQQEAAAAGAGEERPKTTDTFRLRLRRSEHAAHRAHPDAVPTTPTLSRGARNKMLKQCAAPGENSDEPLSVTRVKDEEEDEDDDVVVEEEHPSHKSTSTMTTATSPPQESDGHQRSSDHHHHHHHHSDAAPAPEEAVDESADLGTRLICAICDGVVESDVALAAHIQELGLNHIATAADVDGFACRVCRRVFAAAESLDRHVLSHPGEQVFKCPLCGQALRTNGALHRHAQLHVDGDVAMDGEVVSVRHKRRHADNSIEHDVEAKRRSPSGAEGAEAIQALWFTCPVCPASQPFRAPYLHELERHLEQCHHDYRVSCDMCGDSYKSVRDLNLHRYAAHRGKLAHRSRDVVGFGDINFVDFSSQKFPHIARAECEKSLHRATSRMHPFQCECGRAFPCESALAIHRKACPNTVYVDAAPPPADLSRHSDNKGDFFAKLDLHNNTSAPSSPALGRPAYERDLADIQSMLSVGAGLGAGLGAGMGSLQDHAEDPEEQQDAFAAEFRRMKQRGEFPCRLCPEVFPNLRALKGHNRAHMSAPGADGYRCNMCPHSALDKMALQRHMRTHNGARPYECALCHFAFTTKANCERHLRNRHAKCSRDEVKSSIIYHPSEDPGNDDLKLDVKRSLFAEQADVRDDLASERGTSPLPPATPATPAAPPTPVQLLEDECMRRRSLDVGTMTSEDEADRQSPLDLSMVLDLSKKRPSSPCPDEADDAEEEDAALPSPEDDEDDDQPQDLSRKSTTESQSAVTPQSQSQEALPFSPLGSLYVNPYQLGVQAPLLTPGMPFSAYYPKLPGLLRSLQLGGGLVLEPMHLMQRPSPFLGAAVPGGMPGGMPGDASLPTMPPMPTPPMSMPIQDEPARSSARSASPKSERSSASDSQASHASHASQAHSKMVMKNGVLMPKQKQRRYRTERPHVCKHCSARFTLSSNRERHVKHQHPHFWSQRPRGSMVVRDAPTTPTSAVVPVDASTPRTPSTTPSGKTRIKEEDDEDEGLVIDEERPSSGELVDDGAEGDAEDEGHAHPSIAPPPPPPAVPTAPSSGPAPASAPGEDLVSVSRLLDNASTQTFRQFFRDGAEEAAPTPHEEGSEEDEEGLVAGSPSEGNNSGSEEKSESESAVPQKKKSAYSLAPNRVCCPYCARKFPWTSSLRRHVLTHTGQKPFKCTFCPLLFTTKSNCDRHLARKHSNKKDANSSSSGVSTGTPNSSTTSVSPGSSASSGSPPEAITSRPPLLSPQSFQLRNVPERPYKCRHCPSSTFATLSNLRKHVASKHTGASFESCLLPSEDLSRGVSGYESHSSFSDADHTEDKTCDTEREGKVDMKLPIYHANMDLQPLSLCKTERNDDVKLDTRREVSKDELGLRLSKSSVLDKIAPEASKEIPNSLIPLQSPPIPISAPVVSIPEGTGRSSESSLTLSSSELPFKCHLCDGSFTERQECLDHIRLNHATEYEILSSKGALELNVSTSPEDNNNAIDENQHADGENIEHMRGKFPDYANRKVMCAFCMRRFWSAEDLRRHMRTHTGERPFSCDVCRRRFTLKHSMLRHRKKHNDHPNNNNNSIGAPLIHPSGAEDLSPSANSGDEDGFPSSLKHTPSDLLMHHVKMTNHNNNNINMAGVSKIMMAFCDNHVNAKRNYRRKDEEDSGLISNLLGIGDPSIIDKVLLTKSADDAEKLLGVCKNGSKGNNGLA